VKFGVKKANLATLRQIVQPASPPSSAAHQPALLCSPNVTVAVPF